MKRVLLAAVVALAAGSAWAIPPYARFYKEKYGAMPNCSVCHQAKNWRMTGYGEAFEEGGRTLAALDASEGKDSDGDGAKDGDEARSGSNPGDPNSTPRRLGDWLKDAKVVPPSKPLIQAFPEAVLVDTSFPVWNEDQKRALSEQGDEALYPVVFTARTSDEKVSGRAVHVSCDLPGKAHGTIMALVLADAEGRVAGVRLLHYHGSPELKGESFLNGYKGKAPETLGEGPAAPAGAEKDARALAAAVRKALLILKEAAR